MINEMRKVTSNVSYKVTTSQITSAPVKKEVSQQSETMTMQILKDGKAVSPMDSDATPATNATTNVKYQQEQMSSHKLPPVRDFFVEGDEDKQFRIIETFVESRQGQNMVKSPTLYDLKAQIQEAKSKISAGDLTSLAKTRMSGGHSQKLLVCFANLLELDEREDHDVSSAQSAIKKVGKILSTLSYFDADTISV